MAEPTTALTWTELQRRISRFLGYSTTAADRTTEQQENVDDAILSGLRVFFAEHDWTFLRPLSEIIVWPAVAVAAAVTVTGEAADASGLSTVTATAATFYPSMVGHSIVITGVSTFVIASYTSSTVVEVVGDTAAAVADTFSIAADGDYRMPDDFGAIEGPLTLVGEGFYRHLTVGSEAQIRSARSETTVQTGIPRMAAIQLAAADPTRRGARYNLMLYPTPDQVLTYAFKYQLNNDIPTTNQPNVVGGPLHAETIIAACLAAAEKYVKDNQGVHRADYEKLLVLSKQRDQNQQGENIGYNSDGSVMRRDRRVSGDIVTVDGVIPG